MGQPYRIQAYILPTHESGVSPFFVGSEGITATARGETPSGCIDAFLSVLASWCDAVAEHTPGAVKTHFETALPQAYSSRDQLETRLACYGAPKLNPLSELPLAAADNPHLPGDTIVEFYLQQ
ncbi:MAG: hypothetical protein Q7R76_04955 [Candidatus Woesearchaeota archaeon]|nr:hypothetical protein [Candidatus Woesearchaeota archaeon]